MGIGNLENFGSDPNTSLNQFQISNPKPTIKWFDKNICKIFVKTNYDMKLHIFLSNDKNHKNHKNIWFVVIKHNFSVNVIDDVSSCISLVIIYDLISFLMFQFFNFWFDIIFSCW